MSRLDEALARLERAVARLEAACAGAAGEGEAARRLAEAEERSHRTAARKLDGEPDRLLARSGRALGEKGER